MDVHQLVCFVDVRLNDRFEGYFTRFLIPRPNTVSGLYLLNRFRTILRLDKRSGDKAIV